MQGYSNDFGYESCGGVLNRLNREKLKENRKWR